MTRLPAGHAAGAPGYAGAVCADVLPGVVVIGAMKCATSAVHEYLDAHPDITMSRTKELNFFNGPEVAPHDDAGTWWVTGQWHRGLDWYSSQLEPSAPVRGESSPAYTSPACPEVPARMASVVPEVRLVYLVRDPVDRAASQYGHHRRDGTERRPLDEALLDPGSQYLPRSRYHERLLPFLSWFDPGQVHVVVQERLARRRRAEIARLYEHVGVDPGWRDDRHDVRVHAGGRGVAVPPRVRAEFDERVRDDVARLRELVGDELEEWDP
jgi:hypothetical protein